MGRSYEHVECRASRSLPAALRVTAGCESKRAVRRFLGEDLPDVRGLDGLDRPRRGPGHRPTMIPSRIWSRQRTLIADALGGRPARPRDLLWGHSCSAVALGGSVMAASAAEVGMTAVRLTHAGGADPVLGPLGSPFPVMQWHRECFSLPQDAVRLAGSEACADQAFRWAARAYGLQFHAEIDPPLAERIQPDLGPVRLDTGTVIAAAQAGRSILDRFLRLTQDQPA